MPRSRRALLLLALLPAALTAQEPVPPYRRADLPVETRVADLLRRMTREEKFWQLYLHPADSTVTPGAGRYGVQLTLSGNAVEAAGQLNRVQRRFLDSTRLGIPIIPVAEALHGLVLPGATVYPQAIGLAATWDTALMGEVAGMIATEARTRGIRQVLSPVLNLATDVRWGRVEETYGEDPWLAGLMGQAFIDAFETRGVVATPKHFVANVGDGGRDSYPIELSESRLRAVELPPFERAIRGAAARSVMAAYNSVEGRPASASRWLLTDLLKGEWRFPGVAMSDAGGVGGANVLHGTARDYADATAQAMNAGLDVIFQGDASSASLFEPPFHDGRIPAAVIDSAVARVLRLKFDLGLFDEPLVDTAGAGRVDREYATLYRVALRAALRSAVLLRNQRQLLPLEPRTLRSLALIGADAREARLGGYSGPGRRPVSALQGLADRLGARRVRYAPGPGRTVTRYVTIPASALASGGASGLAAQYYRGPDLSGEPVRRRDQTLDFHWTFMPPAEGIDPAWFSARWSGTITASRSGLVRVGAVGTDGFRLYLRDSLLIDAWDNQTLTERLVPIRLVTGRPVPVRLEFREPSGNGRIRLVWDAGVVDDSEAKIRAAVAAARGASVAVVMVGLEEGEFRDRASLALPGRQEELIRRVAATGTPTVVVIVGGSAVTVRPWIDRVGALLDLWYPGEAGGEALAALLLGDANPGGRLPITFPISEGQLPLVYNHRPTGRGDDYDDLTGLPQFPFGFGLSYTRFTWSDLRIDAGGKPGETIVRCTITNIGSRTGDEVAQLYVRRPNAAVAQPVLALRGFQRVTLAPGASREVEFRVDSLVPGDEVRLAASSRDSRLVARVPER